MPGIRSGGQECGIGCASLWRRWIQHWVLVLISFSGSTRFPLNISHSVSFAFELQWVMQTDPVEKLYRDSKIFTLYEGTSQIQRLIIAKVECLLLLCFFWVLVFWKDEWMKRLKSFSPCLHSFCLACIRFEGRFGAHWFMQRKHLLWEPCHLVFVDEYLLIAVYVTVSFVMYHCIS